MNKNAIYSIILSMILSISSFREYKINIDVTDNNEENIIVDQIIINKRFIVEPKPQVIKEINDIDDAEINIDIEEVECELEVVFNECDLNEISNITYDGMYELLSDTTMNHLSDAIVDSEKMYGVNAFFTLGVIALESSWATSSRANESNNLTGMAVYGDYSPGEYYNTQYECVLETVRQIKKHYLSVDGMYYNGVGTRDVNIKYSANENWHSIVNQIAYEMIEKHNRLTRED